MPQFARVILIVLDGAGCGALPDAALYGDEGSNTLGNVARVKDLRIPNLRRLGLGEIVALGPETPQPEGAFGRMAEASAGKDSVTGHWEMTGIVLEAPFPTFPNGFPRALIGEFENRIGRATIGNVVASGTEIIERLGEEHVRSGAPIVYTSADSVFQLAAHEDVIPVSEQYRMCEVAFDLVSRGLGVARVIARPFVGRAGAFRRTANRHDFALPPTSRTLLDELADHGIGVRAIGKVNDLFAGRGIARSFATVSDDAGMDRVLEAVRDSDGELIFANLVDFDTVYGHRNDVDGYAANLERFDERLGALRAALKATDLLVITGDHGNDPTTPSTDHSREYVPILLSGGRVRRGVDVGTRSTFADLGQTIAANFGIGPLANGASFLEDIVVDHT
ncbi:MAG TPA: phosphopentomutase [Vicinamibacterales bacterium]|nr:phosphopentomutase [Vicinamibacterales bacterium]